MSTTSSASTMVSFRRDDQMKLDDCLNSLYQEIQQNLNYSQCSIRQLAASDERNESFIEASEIHFQLMDYVDTLLSMFKELQKVSLECLGPVPKEFKVEYKKLCDDRREQKKKEKLEMKALEKQMKLNDIKE